MSGDNAPKPREILNANIEIRNNNELPRSKLTGYQKKIDENLSQRRHPRMFLSGVQSQFHLDFRRRTDPSEALWRTR